MNGGRFAVVVVSKEMMDSGLNTGTKESDSGRRTKALIKKEKPFSVVIRGGDWSSTGRNENGA
jgi:hypothetical protein